MAKNFGPGVWDAGRQRAPIRRARDEQGNPMFREDGTPAMERFPQSPSLRMLDMAGNVMHIPLTSGAGDRRKDAPEGNYRVRRLESLGHIRQDICPLYRDDSANIVPPGIAALGAPCMPSAVDRDWGCVHYRAIRDQRRAAKLGADTRVTERLKTWEEKRYEQESKRTEALERALLGTPDAPKKRGRPRKNVEAKPDIG